ncbi:galaxin isoform X3 [Labeo rohita]|uniref:galaxin isoform X3 n=1 Tax=Labeo rohita TaxID=84645 RepID=UPI0021E30EB7|nr:galaxin isoform X3 [Labeo rohita]
MEMYTSALRLLTVLCFFFTSSAQGICHDDGGSHNAAFSGQMDGSQHLHCCGNVSYEISGSSCCKGKITLGLSQLVADCCGSVAFNPLNEICCNGTIQTRFNSRAKCCGNVMYLTATHLCCGRKNIFERKENLSCCGNETYNITTQCCCNFPTLQVKSKNETCCPKPPFVNTALIGNNQQGSPPTSTLPKVSDLMCGDDPYNHQDHICCSGKRHKKASVLTMCCGQDAYTMSDDNMLCCNGNLHRDVPEQSECVGGVIYTPENTTCQMSVRPRLGEHCCGGQTFNPSTHICCNGHSHNKINGNFCCGSDVYDHHNQSLRCCSDRLYIQHSSGNAKCCGNLLLQHSNQTCCSSSTNAVIYDIKQNHSCCGHYYYNTSLWSCCAEHLKPTPKPDSPLALKPLMDLIPEMCNKTVFFGKVESVALLNDQRLVMLKVVWQVNVNSGNFTLDPWLLVSLDHCSSPATDNGMTYLWEKEHSGELTSLHTYKLLSHPVDLISDIHMFYSVCYQKKG